MQYTEKQGNRLLRELMSRARAAGLLEPDTTGAWRALLVHTPLFVASLILATTTASPWLAVLGVLGLAVFGIQIGFTAHDAAHKSVSSNHGVNNWVGQAAFSVINGILFESWWGIFHRPHHKHTQVEALDPDVQTELLVSLTASSLRKKRGLNARLAPYQGYYLWILPLLWGHSLRLQGYLASLRKPRRYWRDLVGMVVHHLLWIALPLLLGASLGQTLVVYLAAASAMSYRLALLFWVNHIGMPTLHDLEGGSYLERQVSTTRNVVNPPAFDWFFGGLNYQIEHHLLPRCPSRKLRKAQAIVRPFCREHGLAYHEERFFAALASVTRHVVAIGRLPTGAGSEEVASGSGTVR